MTNRPLLLQQVVAAVDGSKDPSVSFTSMMVYFLSSLKSLSSDDVSDAICAAFDVFEAGQTPFLDPVGVAPFGTEKPESARSKRVRQV